jgi:hypothetical protein
MAKKAVAGFRGNVKSNAFTKVIVAVKNENGSYSYKSEIVLSENVKDYIKDTTKK